MQSLLSKLLIGICLLLSTQANAQIRDHIILNYKDGSVFIGKILNENSKTASLRLTTSDTISVHKELIKREYRDILFFPNGKFHFTKGLFFNYYSGLGGIGVAHLSALIGKHHNEHLDYGIGLTFNNNWLGFTNGLNIWRDVQFLAPNLYARYYPWSKKIRPYASFAVGYGFSTRLNRWWQDDDFSSGVYFHPSIGVQFASRRGSRTYIGIGQSIQYTKGEINSIDGFGNPIRQQLSLWLNRAVFKVGFEFR